MTTELIDLIERLRKREKDKPQRLLSLCNEAADALTRLMADKWIAVSDKLPAPHERVLILSRGRVELAGHLYGQFYQPYTPYQVTFTDASHWMPLPEAPSNGEKHEP